MGLRLTTSDLDHVEAASRVMLSPLVSGSVNEWRREVNRTLRDLFRADRVVFMLPSEEVFYYSEDAPDIVAGLTAYGKTTEEGLHDVNDPIGIQWNQVRRQERREVFTWDVNEEILGRFGYTMSDSEFVREVLLQNGVRDFFMLHPSLPNGEVLLWALAESKDTNPFGEHAVAMLRTLLPSFHAGLNALTRYDAHRAALDGVSEAVAIFGADHRVLHRNASLEELLRTDPERDRIQAEISRMAHVAHPLGFQRPGSAREAALAPGSRSVTTSRATYDLRASLLPPGAFGGDASIMISVTSQPVAGLPTAETLRQRFGLTPREAEVALLLAEGASNDEIAERLFLSPHTARRHTANIFDKLEVHSRKGLALKFLQA